MFLHVYSTGSDVYGTTSAYWAYRGLYVLAETVSKATSTQTAEMWRHYERQLFHEHAFQLKALNELCIFATSCAADLATRYSTGVAFEALQIAQTTRNAMMTTLTARG